MTLDEIFNAKLTENGDLAFTKVNDNALLNILFLTEYYQNHITELPELDDTPINKLFAMFIRDPRFGLGRRDLGRALMDMTHCAFEDILRAGRADDLFYNFYLKTKEEQEVITDFCYMQIQSGNELVKKWMPRYSSKDLVLARDLAKIFGMNKQQYGHFVKCNTTENKLSRKNYEEIQFEHIPSLAMIKYAKAFANKPELKDRYQKYLEDVKAGRKDMKVSTTTVYDIYKNRNRIDADLFFSKIEKIKLNCIPIIDTSGSMYDSNDSIGKAISIGHYLAKCSTYAPNKVISFSAFPQLITLGIKPKASRPYLHNLDELASEKSQYYKEINSMFTGDCSNTNFGKVMELLSNLDGDMPEYLVVLSDMEFDMGSSLSKEETMRLFKSKGYKTRIVWWNLNSRNITCPEMDKDGNIFLSGYNPMLLKFLQVGFDAEAFLITLLEEYRKELLKNSR